MCNLNKCIFIPNTAKMLKYIFIEAIAFLSVIGNTIGHVDSKKLEEECAIAKICRHDQVPMCGIDSCGEMRTFIDVCDMHEFNCDSQKDYIQKPAHECWVTCKRGRSFKKSLRGAGCDIKNLI